MVSLLIAQKADPMAKDERGHTPLEKARSSGSEEIMRQLQGAMVPAGFDSRCRKLLEAAHKGDVARLRELCASQTELVSQRGPRGASALHVAARYGHAEAVEMLLGLGADAEAADNNGHLPADKAKQLKHDRVLALLVAGNTARDGMTLVPGAAARAAAAHAAESLSQHQQHEQPQQPPQHQETLRRADALRPDAGPRALSPPPPPQAMPEVLLWEEVDSDGKGEEALEALPAVRPLRDDAVAWLLGQGGAALGCCVPLRREEHSADQPLQIGRARGCALLLNDQDLTLTLTLTLILTLTLTRTRCASCARA